MEENLPDVHFGKVEEDEFDWRKENEESLDDDVGGETDLDVIAILGFDPLEFDGHKGTEDYKSDRLRKAVEAFKKTGKT